MSKNATTLRSKKGVGALVKDWMSLVGIALLIIVFSIIFIEIVWHSRICGTAPPGPCGIESL